MRTTGSDGKVNDYCDCSTAQTSDGTSFAGEFCEHAATTYCTELPDHNGHQFCTNGGTCKGESYVHSRIEYATRRVQGSPASMLLSQHCLSLSPSVTWVVTVPMDLWVPSVSFKTKEMSVLNHVTYHALTMAFAAREPKT